MIVTLCLIFFVSGASALMFESLWFNLLGLTLGNSVWASAIVMASFMAGLALGNALAAYAGYKLRRPVRWFALLQGLIALSGTVLVIVFPRMPHILAPVWRIFLSHSFILNGLRMLTAFLLMIIPTTAMGATLPLLVKAIYRKQAHFGRVLGLLYGINTLGAVLGVLLNEFYFIAWFGITGAGVLAGGLNALAAVTALALTKKHATPPAAKPQKGLPLSNQGKRLLVAAFLCGFILLALEVIWFRFLLLFLNGMTLTFAIMLAVVLLGISLGGMSSSILLRRPHKADILVVVLAAVNGLLVVFLYVAFSSPLHWIAEGPVTAKTIWLSLFLMFPISFVSGMLFTVIGHALHARVGEETRSTGLLTFANTTGSMCGALTAGLLLVSRLGMEPSFFTMALLYGIVAFVVTGPAFFNTTRTKKVIFYLLLILYALPLAFFPFGKLLNHYAKVPRNRYIFTNREKLVYYKESITETIQYIETSLLGQPLYYRLITNNHSMSSTRWDSRRYMKLYVYLPIALHPSPKNALLLCYGCGSTAKALVDCKQLEAIDIVDISREIIDAGSVVFPIPSDNPVHDPRVQVHIEDGRFFLLTREKTFDIITAEPPPPTFSGVQNLYSQEFFSLIYDRLSPGGMVTYWLPVKQMDQYQAKAILQAFANSFDHVSLWTGAGFEWMMVGIKRPLPSVPLAHFTAQWQEPHIAEEMAELGLYRPEQLAALYIADTPRIQAFTGTQPPLVDNYPKRLSYCNVARNKQDRPLFAEFMHPAKTLASFASSRLIDNMWPTALVRAAEPYFQAQDTINSILENISIYTFDIHNLHACIHNPMLSSYILWTMGSSPRIQKKVHQELAKNQQGSAQEPLLYRFLAAEAIEQGHYGRAVEYVRLEMQHIPAQDPRQVPLTGLRLYLLFLQGKKKQAYALARQAGQLLKNHREMAKLDAFLAWLEQVFPEQTASPQHTGG